MGKLSALTISPSYDQNDHHSSANTDKNDANISSPIPTLQQLNLINKYHPKITETEVKETKLGSGGYGVVYLGKLTYQQCAVKLMPYRTEDDVKRAQRELKIMRIFLDKPAASLVKFHGAFKKDGYCNIITEHMNLGSLDSLINKSRYNKITTQQRIGMASHIANGLSFIHSINIIHCDIKAANVLVSEDYYGNLTVKLADFGVSQKASPGQRFTGGTAYWQAPEVLVDGEISFASDVYSTGLVFFQIIAAQSRVNTAYSGNYKLDVYQKDDPAREETKRELLKKYLCREKRMSVPSNCPKEFKSLIHSMWKTRPEDRPTAEQVVDSLNTMKIK